MTTKASEAEIASDRATPYWSRHATKSSAEAPMSRPTTADKRQRAVRLLENHDDENDELSKSDKSSG